MVDRWKSEDKKSPWPWILAGRFQFEEKRFKKGLSLLNTALEKSPQAAQAYYWRGRCYEAQGKDLDAANEYRAAIISQESYPEAQQALDLILAKLGPASSN
jgi:tetratricopeptide (TPR) repeat protein